MKVRRTTQKYQKNTEDKRKRHMKIPQQVTKIYQPKNILKVINTHKVTQRRDTFERPTARPYYLEGNKMKIVCSTGRGFKLSRQNLSHEKIADSKKVN